MKTILLVEDDTQVRQALKKLLQRDGHRCIQASNGRLALEILNDNPDISLIVTDLHMPELNGAELINRVRENTRHGSMPILAISGASDASEAPEKLADGPSRLIVKPVSRTLLLSEVQSLLNRSGPASISG
jgi:CheY-like chemotaxis protein